MEYENFIFKDIMYKNGPERDPLLKMKYRAESIDDGTPKKAKDKFDELPQSGFREVWGRLIDFWKMNIEHVLTGSNPIDWDLRSCRIQRIKIKWESGDPVAVKYIAKVSTGFDETEKIPTPYVQPSMEEGELDVIKDLCEYSIRFLHGERDQAEISFGGEDESNKNQENETEVKTTDLSDVF